MELKTIRNIGIIAHIDAGKTTLSERILFYTGKNYKMGEVHTGEATMDFMDQEQERGITIYSAATTCFWRDHHINIIDTPGHVDFTMEVERSLRVLDGAIAVFCGVAGVQAQSETVFRQASKFNIPKMAFINKMDRQGAHFDDVIKDMHDKLKTCTIVATCPYFIDEEFAGVIDVLRQELLMFDIMSKGLNVERLDVPEAYHDTVHAYREELFNTLSDLDDDFAELYLTDDHIQVERIIPYIHKYTCSGDIMPVFCGAAFKNKGIQPLLNGVVDFFPSPLEAPPMKAFCQDGAHQISVPANVKDEFRGLVFKVVTDPYQGRLAYVRAYSGTLTQGMKVYNSRGRAMQRVNRILRIHANKKETVKTLPAGDICALTGLSQAITGDTILENKEDIFFEAIASPDSVIYVAIEPKSSLDSERLLESIHRIVTEDPSLRVTYNEETGQTLIGGMGELHLEIVCERLRRDFGVAIHVSKPKVAYKETITRPAKGVGRFVKQSGGAGQFGHVVVEIAPDGSDTVHVTDKTRDGSIPKDFIPAVIRGVEEAAGEGALSFPVVGVQVNILEGSYHEVDSSEIAFRIAGSMALKDAIDRAGAVLMEPVMRLEVVIPEEYIGSVLGDLNAKRSRITSLATRAGAQIINAEAPLAEMFGYSTDLRSLTKGRGTFMMAFLRYEKCSPAVADEVLHKLQVVYN